MEMIIGELEVLEVLLFVAWIWGCCRYFNAQPLNRLPAVNETRQLHVQYVPSS
jgi:hypothetical protein